MALPRLIVAASALLVLACGGAGGAYVVDSADQAVLFTVEDLNALTGATTTGPGTFTKTRDFDGAWNLEYDYEDDERAILTALFLENDADDASWVLFGASVTDALLAGEDIDYVQSDTLCSGGDERNCGTLRTAGVDVGVLCAVRQGSRVGMVMVAGPDFSRPGGCDPLVLPMLEAARSHVPSSTLLPEPP